jgi:hypothetical protein
MKVKDLVGIRFGRLVVLSFEVVKKGHSQWLCKCDCGNTKIVRGSRLCDGSTTSCGCYQKETTSALHIRHGLTDSTTHKTWSSMITRCSTLGNKNYGGRGITVCERWLEKDGKGFLNFLADMGQRPVGKTLDRFPDNNGNYEKSNCRWASQEEQRNNTRRNRIIEVNGKKMSLSEAVKLHGLNYNTVFSRLSRGWPVDKALGMSI